MNHLTNAIKRPFTDFGKLLIGIIFCLIPIVNFISIGYHFKCAKTAMTGKFVMPKWENFGNLFITGLLGSIISFVYMFPALVLLFLALATIVDNPSEFIMVAGNNIDFNSLLIEKITGPVLVLFAFGIILFALGGLLSSSAMINYSNKFKFEDGFKKLVWKKAFTGKFIWTWILAGVYGSLIAIILAFIPNISFFDISDGIQRFVYGVTYMTALATIYKKL